MSTTEELTAQLAKANEINGERNERDRKHARLYHIALAIAVVAISILTIGTAIHVGEDIYELFTGTTCVPNENITYRYADHT